LLAYAKKQLVKLEKMVILLNVFYKLKELIMKKPEIKKVTKETTQTTNACQYCAGKSIC